MDVARELRAWAENVPDQELHAIFILGAKEIERLRAALADALNNLDHVVEAQVRATHNL